jgi:hypothetical protein
MSEGFGVGCGDGSPAGGIRDAHAHVIARRQQTKMVFTSFRTLMIAVCPQRPLLHMRFKSVEAGLQARLINARRV